MTRYTQFGLTASTQILCWTKFPKSNRRVLHQSSLSKGKVDLFSFPKLQVWDFLGSEKQKQSYFFLLQDSYFIFASLKLLTYWIKDVIKCDNYLPKWTMHQSSLSKGKVDLFSFPKLQVWDFLGSEKQKQSYFFLLQDSYFIFASLKLLTYWIKDLIKCDNYLPKWTT